MSTPKPLPPELTHRPFTVYQGRDQGVTTSRSRARDLWIPSRSIRVPRNMPFDLLDHARPYTALTSGSVVSHLSAARIHGLRLPSWCADDNQLHLSRPAEAAAPRRRHVHGHRMAIPPAEVTLIQGVPVTSIVRTALDLSSLLALDDLVILLDQIICEHHRAYALPTWPLVSLTEVRGYVDRQPARRGVRRLRAALELARVGADSPPETRLRLLITRSTLPEFEPNLEICTPDGRSAVSPDLGCKRFKTCLEYDGGHHTTPEQLARDHDRDFLTASLGWHQLILNKADLRAGAAVVLSKIARTLVLGGWEDPTHLAQGDLAGLLSTRGLGR